MPCLPPRIMEEHKDTERFVLLFNPSLLLTPHRVGLCWAVNSVSNWTGENYRGNFAATFIYRYYSRLPIVISKGCFISVMWQFSSSCV